MTKLTDSVTGARIIGGRFLQSQRPNPQGQMPLMDHLRELRNRVLKAALAIVLGTGAGLYPPIFNVVFRFVEHPFCSAVINGQTGCHKVGDQLIVSGVLDPFMLRVKVAFFFGLLITSPFWMYQVWAFIAPGLYRRERRWTYAFLGTAVPLFFIGTGLAYVVMSRGLRYLLGVTPGSLLNLPSIDTYLSYFVAMMLGFSLAFELPLALVLLNFAGILSHQRIRKWRRYMIFLVFVFSGIASPSPDPITMLMLAVPCVLLVEIAEVLIYFNDRRRGRLTSPYDQLSDDEISPLDLDDVGAGRGSRDGRPPGAED